MATPHSTGSCADIHDVHQGTAGCSEPSAIPARGRWTGGTVFAISLSADSWINSGHQGDETYHARCAHCPVDRCSAHVFLDVPREYIDVTWLKRYEKDAAPKVCYARNPVVFPADIFYSVSFPGDVNFPPFDLAPRRSTKASQASAFHEFSIHHYRRSRFAGKLGSNLRSSILASESIHRRKSFTCRRALSS